MRCIRLFILASLGYSSRAIAILYKNITSLLYMLLPGESRYPKNQIDANQQPWISWAKVQITHSFRL